MKTEPERAMGPFDRDVSVVVIARMVMSGVIDVGAEGGCRAVRHVVHGHDKDLCQQDT